LSLFYIESISHCLVHGAIYVASLARSEKQPSPESSLFTARGVIHACMASKQDFKPVLSGESAKYSEGILISVRLTNIARPDQPFDILAAKTHGTIQIKGKDDSKKM